MHLINKKTRLKYHRCTASIYSGHQANILSKLSFMFTCFTKKTIKYTYRKRKTIPQTFFNFAVFCFCYYKSASDTNQNNTETMTTCKINFPEEK